MRSPEPKPVEYPLLGEPAVVEFINTENVDPDGTFDFLATVDLARGWFRALEPFILTDVEALDETARCGLVELRSAIRTVFDTTRSTNVERAIAVVESAINASPGRITLTRDDQNRYVRHTVHETSTPAGTAALLADAAIEIATEPGPGRVLVCDRPACNMRYFQQHRRRRYCNPRCANSDRQSRFQQTN